MEHQNGRPVLSVVAVTRNDNHGGDLRARMQQFVGGFIEQCKRHHLNAELILVEWNPPSGQPPLEHALNWPDDFGPATIRIVTVPASLHAKFEHAASLPLFQMIGKNVGIRRARGQYVLATNVDVLFNDALTCYLRDRLEPRIVLRVDRYDVPRDLVANAPFDEVMADCSGRFFQVNMRLGTYDAIALKMTTGRPGALTALQGIVYGAQVFGVFGIAHRVVSAGTIRAVADRSKLMAVSAFKKLTAFRLGHSILRRLELLAVSTFRNLAVLLENLAVGTRRTVQALVFTARVGLRKLRTKEYQAAARASRRFRCHPVVGVSKREPVYFAQARKVLIDSASKNQSLFCGWHSLSEAIEGRRHPSTHGRSLVAVCAEICRRSEISEVALAAHQRLRRLHVAVSRGLVPAARLSRVADLFLASGFGIYVCRKRARDS